MKRWLIILTVILSLFACKKICDGLHKGADRAAKAMELRWDCDYQKTYDFFISKIDKTVCTKYPDEKGVIGMVAAQACSIIVKEVMKYPAKEMEQKLSCNYDKVYADIKNISAVCILLNLIPY